MLRFLFSAIFFALINIYSENNQVYAYKPGIVNFDWGRRTTKIETLPVKTYKIDLDLPAKQRWAELINDKRDIIVKFYHKMTKNFLVNLYINIYAKSIKHIKDPEFIEEVKALTELLQIPENIVYMVQYTYELLQEAYAIIKKLKGIKACSSIIVRNKDGHIFHARNLDYGVTAELAKITVIGEFYKGGKLLYKADLQAGYLGINTGMKPGKFSLSLNQRFYNKQSLKLVKNGKHFSVGYQIRRVLQEAQNFSSAVRMVQTLQITANAYFIVAGLTDNEGVVITRGINSVDDMGSLSEIRWYVIQTNYDRSRLEPVIDVRKTYAILRLEVIGSEQINEQTVFDRVMTQYPTFNFQTLSTTLMSPQTGYYNLTIWK